MDGLVQWGVTVIQWIQSFRNPMLDQFFLTINVLGDEEFYLLFFPLIYWCFSKPVGYRLAFVFLFSDWCNQFLKDLFAAPRPYQVDSTLYAPIKTTGYGIPSGHTQGTTVTWGNLATQLKKPVWWVIAVAVPLCVGIGRMYLGDHFPQDVIAGALIGIVLVGVYAVLQPRAEAWLSARVSFVLKLTLAVIVPVLLAVIYLSTAAVSMGALLGFGVGLVIEEKHVRFSVRGEWWKQIIKVAIGIAIGMGLRFALKAVLGDAAIMNMVRYAVIGFWFALGAPWVFVIMRLSKREE